MNTEGSGKSVVGLLGDVAQHFGNLVHGEITLARAETAETIRGAIGAVAIIVVAVMLAQTALNVLAAALVAGLSGGVLPPAWSAVVVGAVLALVALVLLLKGVTLLRSANLVPERTVRNVQKDAETLKEVVRNDPPI